MAYRFQFPSNPRTLCMLESEEAGRLLSAKAASYPRTLVSPSNPRTLIIIQ